VSRPTPISCLEFDRKKRGGRERRGKKVSARLPFILLSQKSKGEERKGRKGGGPSAIHLNWRGSILSLKKKRGGKGEQKENLARA